MPQGLRRYYGQDHLHFINCSCYHRQPWLATPQRRDLFSQILEEARQHYGFVVVGYVVMPEHIHMLISEPERGAPSSVMQVVKQRLGCWDRPKPRIFHRLAPAPIPFPQLSTAKIPFHVTNNLYREFRKEQAGGMHQRSLNEFSGTDRRNSSTSEAKSLLRNILALSDCGSRFYPAPSYPQGPQVVTNECFKESMKKIWRFTGDSRIENQTVRP